MELTRDQIEKILKWAGWRHYNPDNPQTYWIDPEDKTERASFEPNLNSLDVLWKIIERNDLTVTVFCNHTHGEGVLRYSVRIFKGLVHFEYSDSLVEAMQKSLLEMVE
jgi:hypothetical protein